MDEKYEFITEIVARRQNGDSSDEVVVLQKSGKWTKIAIKDQYVPYQKGRISWLGS